MNHDRRNRGRRAMPFPSMLLEYNEYLGIFGIGGDTLLSTACKCEGSAINTQRVVKDCAQIYTAYEVCSEIWM